MKKGQSLSIPRIIHHVWVSGDAMPDSVLATRQTWIDRHPDWEFRVWRLEDLDWLRNRSLFDRSAPYSQKSDFARYEVVHRFGGVYLDTDMECLRPLDSLLAGCEFFAGREPNGKLGSAIFGAVPSHPIPRQMIERLPASCLVHRREPLSHSTGPLLLTRVVRDGAWEGREGIRIFPPAYFFPYSGGEVWRRREVFAHAYAAHHWQHSWKGQRGVTPKPGDLLPRSGEAKLPSARALWREAGDQVTTKAKQQLTRRVLWPAKRFAKAAAHRVVPISEPLRAVPWGAGEVLIATPLGTRLLCPTDDLSIGPGLALSGTFHQPFADLVQRWRLRPGMTFVDVGASFGFSTILGAARVGPGGKVFAYECNPELVEFARRNIEMNGFADRVRLVAKAAHRDDEERRLRVPDRMKGLGSLAHFDGVDAETFQEFEVPCERLDVGLRDVSFVDLLRIDVEGGEAAVLDGTSGLLDEGKIGVIAMELRDDERQEGVREEIEKALTSLVQDRGAALHVSGDPRGIPLDEVLTVFRYPQLLVRFPGATILP